MSKKKGSEKSSKSKTCRPGGSGAAHGIQDLMIKSALAKIKNKLLVMSGKGGVGKSSIAANISVALSKRGFKTGLLDIDLHGPSIVGIMGLSGLLDTVDGAFLKPKTFSENLQVVSVGSLMRDENQAIIWRGPAKIGAIRQFIGDVKWGDLDYLVIDSPPGTGDEPLTVAQTMPDTRAIVVTTPQEISLGDVRKSISFCRHLNLDILGIVENMGTFSCPHCGEPVDLFRKDGGKVTAELMSVPFLGTVPFDQEVVKACDGGKPIMSDEGDSAFTRAFHQIVDKIIHMTGAEPK